MHLSSDYLFDQAISAVGFRFVLAVRISLFDGLQAKERTVTSRLNVLPENLVRSVKPV